MKKGKFIVLEGINGCGKGTQLPRLTETLYGLSKAHTVFRTREPNEFDKNGKLAREMLLSDGSPYQNNLDAVRYFAENRKTHNGIFVPMLENGIHVLSDRYWHSNFAFQHAQSISYEDIAKANEGSRAPDLTIILDVPVEVAFERLEKRDGENRRKFDSNRHFLEKARRNYLELGEVLPHLIGDRSIVYADGAKSIDDVSKEIEKIVKQKF